ncbi:hypothetical protein RHSIM_Rhsim09G0205400 [Rhododendron simsii]|uniref:Uncharacterized protein n=1 Tax=Rhododendron simsii TaxID=118357 RepID=A0A834GD75_RHOSS|nr:hypothetical protein RHSIM_Rhsim09G0205400 [Rhododendron simsii]
MPSIGEEFYSLAVNVPGEDDVFEIRRGRRGSIPVLTPIKGVSNIPMEGGFAAVHNTVYCIGGDPVKQPKVFGHHRSLPSLFSLDNASRSWKKRPSMRIARSQPQTVAVDCKIYVISGADYGRDPATLWGEVFDTKSGKWVSLSPPSPLPEGYGLFTVAVPDFNKFVLGSYESRNGMLKAAVKCSQAYVIQTPDRICGAVLLKCTVTMTSSVNDDWFYGDENDVAGSKEGGLSPLGLFLCESGFVGGHPQCPVWKRRNEARFPGGFVDCETAKEMCERLKIAYGTTSATRLRALTLKFESYVMDPKHTMAENLRMMSAMIRNLKAAGYALTDEQLVMLLPMSSRHLELEAERMGVLPELAKLHITDVAQRQSSKVKCKGQGKRAGKADYSSSSYVAYNDDAPDSVTWHTRLGTHRYGKLGPRANKQVFIRYSDCSKGYVMYGEHPSADEAVMVHCDSMAALAYTKDPKYHGRTKHIDICFHYIWDMIALGEVTLQCITTGRMVADPLTKANSRDVFQTHVRSMGLCRL